VTLARYTWIVCGLLGALLGLTLLALHGRLEAQERWAMAYGGGLAGLNTIGAYALAQWGARRSPRAFLAAVLGGMVGRMGLMLLAVVAGIVGLGLPRLPLVFTLLGFFVLFLVFEIAVLQRRTTAAETR
jgi:hypothetical protein